MRIRDLTFTILLSSWIAIGCSNSDSGIVVPNNPPNSVAGPNQSVDEGALVQLTGQGNDPEGTALSFLWSQISGPAVVLSSVSAPAATFVAPEVPIRNTDAVVLSLLVTDATGMSGTDQISIHIASTDYGVFIANKEDVRKDELYRYDPEADVVSKLSGPSSSSDSRVSRYSISPDGQWVAYRADQDTDNIDELYVAAADGSGATKVSGVLPPNGDVHSDFVWSPDSSVIAYFADADQLSVQDLFVVDPLGDNLRKIAPTDDQTPAIVKLDKSLWSPDGQYLAQTERSLTENIVLGINVYDLSAAFPSNVRITPAAPAGAIRGGTTFRWAPDSSRLAYTANFDTVEITELYTVRPDGIDNTKVSAPLVVGGGASGPSWSPDSSRLAYWFRTSISADIQFHTVRPDGTDETRVSDAPVASDFSGVPFWSPDSSRIAYITEQDAAGVFEVRTVLPDGAGSVSISGPLDRNLSLRFPATSLPVWSPDSSRVAYVGVGGGAGVVELYSVRPDGTDRVKVNGPLVPGGDLLLFPFWSPDSSLISYIADQDTDDVIEIYTVRPDGANNFKVNGPLVAGGNTGGPFWSPDGSRIAYGAGQVTASVSELYLSTPDGAININISGPLVPGGRVFEFSWSP